MYVLEICNNSVYLLMLTTVAGVKHLSTCVCVCVCVYVCVCLHDRTKMAETTITKLASTGYPFNIRSKVTGSQSAKHTSGDQVAGVSLHSIEWPASSSYIFTFVNLC